jgi:copper chaperone
MGEATVIVTGMTCDHCVRVVKAEVSKLAGVTDVAVDLASGRVTIWGSAELDADAVAQAVEAAGYEVAS